MKPIEHTAIRGGLSLGALLLAASLCLGGEPGIGSEQKAPAKAKATATAKKKTTAAQAEEKRVEVTGSHLKYRVKDGEQTPATALSVTVIDLKSAVNRGYSSPLEALMRTPSVYRGR